jgi:hypothetical protein
MSRLMLFFAIIPLISYSKVSHLTCSATGTKLIFINGVNVDDREYFVNFRDQVTFLFSTIDQNNTDSKATIEFSVPHNRSESQLRDLAETFFLFMQRYQKDSRHNSEPLIPDSKLLNLFVSSLLTTKFKFEYACKNDPDPRIQDICKEIRKIREEGQKSITFEDLGRIRKIVSDAIAENKKIIFL